MSLLAVVVFRRTRRRWLRLLCVAHVILLWYVFLWGSYIGVTKLDVVRVELEYDDLPEAFDGYKIVHFVDAHVASFDGWREKYLLAAIDSINAQHADAVVFTGDLQNREPSEVSSHLAVLKRISARDGVFSVLGNHDYPMYMPSATVQEKQQHERMTRKMQEDMGWKLLLNSNRTVYRGHDSIVIAGMENDGTGRFPELGDMKRALDGVGSQAFVVMLEHDPSAWQRKILPYRQRQPQLTLSGHTHGGQLALLGLSPAALTYKHHTGMYTSGKRKLFVTKGLGGVIPFRFGVSPEIVVITLHKRPSA